MSFLNNYESKQKGGKTNQAPEGMTMAEILANKSDSINFGLYLKTERTDPALTERLISGTLKDGDINELEGLRSVFAKKIEKARELSDYINEENVVSLAGKSPGVQKILNLMVPAKAVTVFKNMFEKMSITDGATFSTISSAITTLEDYKNGKLKDVEDGVQCLIEKYRIKDEEALTEALQIKNKASREEALAKIVKDGHGKIRKLFDWMTDGNSGFFRDPSLIAKVSELNKKKGQIEKAILEVNKKMKSVGEVLASSVNNNPDLLNAFSKELIGKKVDKDGNNSAFKDLYSVPETEKTEEEIIKEMQVSLDKKIKDMGATWTAKTKKEKDDYVNTAFKNDYKDDSKKEYKKKSGFWSFFFSMLFDSFDKKVDSIDKTKFKY